MAGQGERGGRGEPPWPQGPQREGRDPRQKRWQWQEGSSKTETASPIRRDHSSIQFHEATKPGAFLLGFTRLATACETGRGGDPSTLCFQEGLVPCCMDGHLTRLAEWGPCSKRSFNPSGCRSPWYAMCWSSLCRCWLFFSAKNVAFADLACGHTLMGLPRPSMPHANGQL